LPAVRVRLATRQSAVILLFIGASGPLLLATFAAAGLPALRDHLGGAIVFLACLAGLVWQAAAGWLAARPGWRSTTPFALGAALVAAVLAAQAPATGLPVAGPARPGPEPSARGARRVEVRLEDGRHRLYRDGEPYVIRGAGVEGHLAILAAAGGNSIRTWGFGERDRELFEEAHRRGLTATIGLWMGHERDGFDYGDRKAVARQHAELMAIVREVRHHPALLMWGVGNELELGSTDPRVWDAVEALARSIREVDPDHPTMLVISSLDVVGTLALVRERCPSIQIIGVNRYEGMWDLPEELARGGWDGPYVIAEWGLEGFWTRPETAWRAPIEPTSAEKTAFLWQAHAAMGRGQDRLLGSYAFFWGQKQEVTPTWFSLIVLGGYRTPMIDALSEIWTGRPPPGLAPDIARITLAGVTPLDPRLPARSRHVFRVAATSPTGSPLTYHWEVLREAEARPDGGRQQARPEQILCVQPGPEPGTAIVTVPDEPGPYRLYVQVRDATGRVATDNLPFWVDAS
jgi:hypothetical protein